MKEIQIFLIEGPCPFSRGDNYNKIVKIHLVSLKIFSSRTTGPISTKHGTKHPRVKGTQVFTNKDHSILKKEIIGLIFDDVLHGRAGSLIFLLEMRCPSLNFYMYVEYLMLPYHSLYLRDIKLRDSCSSVWILINV